MQATTSEATTSSRMFQDVGLFWDAQNNDSTGNDNDNSIVKISLCPLSNSKGAWTVTTPLTELEKTDDDEIMSDEIIRGNGSDTPGSVLQFERALRKAQHAKKAGKDLSANDLKIVYKDDHIIVVVRRKSGGSMYRPCLRVFSHGFPWLHS